MTYTWEATGQASPITRQSLVLSDTAVMSWTLAGDHVITVTAQNAAGVVTGTHSIAITPIGPLLFGSSANEMLRGTGGMASLRRQDRPEHKSIGERLKARQLAAEPAPQPVFFESDFAEMGESRRRLQRDGGIGFGIEIARA